MEKEIKETIPQHYYTEKEANKLSTYIEQQYGEADFVGHELVSPDIHCDIVVIPPFSSPKTGILNQTKKKITGQLE